MNSTVQRISGSAPLYMRLDPMILRSTISGEYTKSVQSESFSQGSVCASRGAIYQLHTLGQVGVEVECLRAPSVRESPCLQTTLDQTWSIRYRIYRNHRVW